LVNGRTEGSAEALAAALRQETGSALIGQPTAGTHGVFRDVTLKDGTQLQVPVGRIRLGDGSTLAEGPLTPDIRIVVAEKSERGFLENPTTTLKPNGVSGTNSSATTQRRKVTEADLVRAQRSEPTDSASETNAAPKTSVNLRLADPVLARAADLVRGLAAFQKAR
jgi:C-terminal processing protease CtpA/Prc